MEKRVEVTISEGVADVRLVRADKMNALDAAMFEALLHRFAPLHTCSRLLPLYRKALCGFSQSTN